MLRPDPLNNPLNTRDPMGKAGGINLYGFVGRSPVNWIDPWEIKCCNQRWDQCYTNCINFFDPIGNLAQRCLTSLINRRILAYIGSKLPTRGARKVSKYNLLQANRASVILMGWQAGTSYGCMISCAIDSCNY